MGEIPKHVQKCPQRRAEVIVVPAIHPDKALPMGKSEQTVARSITLDTAAEAGEIQVYISWNRWQTKVRQKKTTLTW